MNYTCKMCGKKPPEIIYNHSISSVVCCGCRDRLRLEELDKQEWWTLLIFVIVAVLITAVPLIGGFISMTFHR